MRNFLISYLLILCVWLAISDSSQAQIYAPEGLNMPGAWNGWTNPPAINSAFGGVQTTNGKITLITHPHTQRYQTIFNVAASGADVAGGNYEFLFTSGPSGNYYSNKWNAVGVNINQLQTYTKQSGGANNNVTLTDNKWYTVNFENIGYVNARAIFMETSAVPVSVSSITQDPLSNAVGVSDDVTVNVTLSAVKSAEEKIYVRYTTDNFVSSTLVEITNFGGTTQGSAVIPGTVNQADITVKYYVFSTTVSSPGADYDLYTINFNDNSGVFFSYRIDNTAPTISQLSPLDDENDVVINSNLVITFSENVVKGTGNIYIKRNSDNSVFETINVSSSNVTISDDEVTINPISNFQYNILYYIEMDAGVFKDEAAIDFAGISGSATWNFQAEQDLLNWAAIVSPSTASLTKGASIANIYVQLWKPTVTNLIGKANNMSVWVGVNSTNSDPSTWSESVWIPADYLKDVGDNDEYKAVLSENGLSAGTYYYAARLKYSGNPYQYAGYSGGFWNGTTNISGTLTVQDYPGTTIACTSTGVSSSPSFPESSQSITITFDAALGNTALKDLVGNVVYAHTGVTTSEGNWKYASTWLDNDVKYKLTHVSGNTYTLTIPDIYAYYNIPAGTAVDKLSFVFRNADGTKQAKTDENDDFFVPLYNASQLHVRFNCPATNYVVKAGDQIQIDASSNISDQMKLFVDNVEVSQAASNTIAYTLNAGTTPGNHQIKVIAYKPGHADVSQTVNYFITGNTTYQALSEFVNDGINYDDNNTVTLVLYAPEKQFVHVIGDFNNWELDNFYQMKRTPDNLRYWITLTGLEAGREYAFQYLVDGNLRVADPYTHKILDPDNDKYISETVYPNLKSYPTDKTEEIVSVLQTARPAYTWQTDDFIPPAQDKLIIYELHIRDFTETGDLKGVMDKLDYLKNLGINAIELMPINEFEGNDSWGYNPSFYFAPDKAYGTELEYKQFIDACHQRGIAVIIDMVLNHSFNQSPMVRMYFDKANNRPAANNPWFNQTAPNTSYSWGSDFNHEWYEVQKFVDSVNQFWITKFKVDGIRFDFTKGFTQTGGDGWAYDASRIAILKRMYNFIRNVNPNTYVIMEHLAENSEEIELSNHGIMLWGNMEHQYSEALSGFTANFANANFKNRSFTYANLVSYAQSHDEERNAYKAKTYGNQTNPAHDVKLPATYIYRSAATEAFNLLMPGPRMLWQFEELAYDISIDQNGRTGKKPVKWDYFDVPERRNLYTQVAKMIQYKKENPEIFSWKIDYFEDGNCKRIRYINPDKPDSVMAVVIANFGVSTATILPGFNYDGLNWFNILDGTYIGTQNSTATNKFSLNPGEVRILIRTKASQSIHYTVRQPFGKDTVYTIDEDISKQFAASDFSFFSIDNKTFSGIKITTLPTNGSLKFNNNPVTINTLITDITKLVYSPDENENGLAFDLFNFQIADNATPTALLSEKTYKATINVTAVNDAPVISGQQAVTIMKNTSHEITLSELSVSDVDNTYPADFALTVNSGTNYTVSGNTITPAVDFSGTLTIPVTVNDGNSNSASFNFTITVLDKLNTVSPDATQLIFPSTNGGTLTVTENITVSSREWKYRPAAATVLPYESFSPMQSGTTYTPNFTQKGVYYVVCVSTLGGTAYNSNEIRIEVKDNQTISFIKTDAQFNDADFYPATTTSGLEVILSVPANNNVVTIVNNKIHIVGTGSVEVTANQSGNEQYRAASEVKQTITIAKAAQQITFGTLAAKTFGDPSFDLEATSSANLEVSYTSSNTSVATILGKTVTIVGSGSCTITATQAGDANYAAADNVNQILTVSKKSQTITFETLPNKTYGDNAFTLSATSVSGLEITFTSQNSDIATIIGNTVTIVGAGTTAITASQAGDADYAAATDVVQILTVNKADQTITFNALPVKTTASAAFDLTATSSSGLSVSYNSSDVSVATISGSTVTIAGAGTTEIAANQEGNNNYNPAPEVRQVLTVESASSVNDTQMEGVRIFPNPVTDVLIIELEKPMAKLQYSVMNMAGSIILSGEIDNSQTIISFKNNKAGVYFVKLSGNGKTVTYKIIVNN